MGSYYPQARVKLFIRFEEYDGDNQVEFPKKPSTMREGNKDDPIPFKNTLDKNGQSVYVLDAPVKSSEASKDLRTFLIEGIVPLTATLTKNSIRVADTLDVELPFIDFPFDPRAVRSMGIEYYQGIVSETERESAAKEKRPPILEERSSYGSNLRFQGWVTSWRASWSSMAEGKVKLSCRDNTALLIDQEAPTQLTVASGIAIDKAVTQYLASFPQFAGLGIKYLPTGEEPPVLKSQNPKHDKKKKSKGKSKAASPTADRMSVWDYLTDLAGRVGCIVRMKDTDIVFQRARTLLNGQYKRPDDPFAPDLNSDEPNRVLIFGKTLMDFSVTRNFGASAPYNVEIRCYIPARKQTIVARFPGTETLLMPGQKGDRTVKVFRVAGVGDQDMLHRIAQNIYEEISRQELEVSMSSYELASFGSNETNADLLWLESGDPVTVYFEQTTPNEHPSSSKELEATLLLEDKMIEYLTALGYDKKLAKAYAKAYQSNGFQTTFRVKNIAFNWNSSNGLKLKIEAINYVEIRYDKPLNGE